MKEKMFPQAEWELEQWENVSRESRKCVQSKINFRDIKKKGVGVRQKEWGEGKGILQEKKKRKGMVLIYVNWQINP